MISSLPRYWILRAAPLLILATVAVMGKMAVDRGLYASSDAGSGVLDIRSSADRGPGSLRDALFQAMTADRRMQIRLHVDELVLENPLPGISVPKGVEIVGAGGEPTRLSLAPEWSGDRTILKIAGDQVSLSNLHVDAGGRNGIRLRGADSSLSRVHVVNAKVAVDQTDVDRTRIVDSHFENNRIAVRFRGAVGLATVSGNTFSNNAESALWVVFGSARDDSEPVRIIDNRIRGGRQAIVLGNANVWVADNRLSGYAITGITLLGASATIRNNMLSDSEGIGMRLQSPRATVIEGNDIGHHKLVGVLFVDPDRLKITANRIHNNAYGVAAVGRTVMQARIHNNDLLAQTADGVVAIGYSPVIVNNRMIGNRRAGIRFLNLLVHDEPPINAVPRLARNVVRANGFDQVAYGDYRVPES